MSRIPLNSGWSNEPAPSEQRYRIPLLRCREGKALEVVFLHPTAIGRYLHWDGFRTVPCVDGDCPFCKCGFRRDWKLYIPVWQPSCDQVAMLELPYSALKFFQRQYLTVQTSYGFHATIGRHGGNPKGKVVVLFRGKYRGTTPLPEAPSPVEYMARVWGIIPPDPTPSAQRGSKNDPSVAANNGFTGDSTIRLT